MKFNWAKWRSTFDLPPDVLWRIPSAYPSLVATDVDGGEGPSLTASLLQAIVSPIRPQPIEQFDAYLEAGELAAASAMAPIIPGDAHELERQRIRIAERRESLEFKYNHEEAALVAAHRYLVTLGVRSPNDRAFDGYRSGAAKLRDIGRLGPALSLLSEGRTAFEAEGNAAGRRLDEDIKSLQADAAASSLSDPIVHAIDEYICLAQKYQSDGIVELAVATIRRAREAMETGVVPPVRKAEASEHYRLRPTFPHRVRARDIINWIENGQVGGIDLQAWQGFRDVWLPRDWTPGREPDDTTFSAIRQLARSAKSAPSSSSKTWANFLKDLFELLGRRDHQPNKLNGEALPKRTLSDGPSRGMVGFWLGWCKPSLAFRGTFIDPDRIGERGLPMIVWHRPREGRGPRASNLETPLNNLGIRLQPILVLANEPVDPEDRRALQRVAPGASLLDETALLRIILSHAALPEGYDPQPMRQLHFVAAISAQLPPKQASPFTESGAASDVMFFGRNDVLQQLQDPNGPTVLYGGRRLGKSSILKQIRRLFVAADPAHNIGIYVDAIDAGMSRESVIRLAYHIAEQLRSYAPPVGRAIQPPFRDHVPVPSGIPEFLDILRHLLITFPQHRLLLLLDEADALCAYLDVLNTPDLLPEQRLGWGLRSLVAEFPGRFDVRFAGFQEIHRSTTSPDGPFFNFRTGSTSLPLKVFEPAEAVEMLVSTLRNLAVEFDNPASIDRVLEFTGHHPALLQECGKRLYELVRARSHAPWRISTGDVDAVMLDPAFRKSVVTTIHLNVSRPTRAQRTLALLLYLWVREIMAPEQGGSPRETRTARDLFNLVEREIGSAAGRQLDVAAIEAYLGDLVVLGVLERRGNAYAFAYRAFATLLYHDYFAGGLNRSTILDQWQMIGQDSTIGRTLLPTHDGGHTLSPLSRDAQERLASALGHVPVLLLGPAGSGLSLTTHWAGSQAPPEDGAEPRLVEVSLASTNARGLRVGLAEALGDLPSDSWVTFWEAANERVAVLASAEAVTTILIDGLDGLAMADDLPLFLFDAPPDLGHDHLFTAVGSLIRRSEGRVRFLFSGGLSTARIWVDNAATLLETTSLIQTERLSVTELPRWLEASRLIPSHGEVPERIAALTGGDWRLLAALRGWLRRRRPSGYDAIDVDAHALDRFAEVLNDRTTRETKLPDLELRLQDPNLVGLRMVSRAAVEFGLTEGSFLDWREACQTLSEGDSRTGSWSPARWDTELRALVLIGEIGEVVGVASRRTADNRLVVPVDDPWLTLVRS